MAPPRRPRKAEAEADRDRLWAEAEERERLLAATMEREQASRGAPQGATDERLGENQGGHQVVFVVASDAFADKLQHFSPKRDRLVSVMPARESDGGTGLRGAWLVFEKG